MAAELLQRDQRHAASHRQNISTSSNFYTSGDGRLYCENLGVKFIQNELARKTEYASPFYLYSRAQIEDNVRQYKNALEKHEVTHLLGFTVQANNNLEILRLIQKLGCTAICSSGNEMRIAMMAGFNPNNMVFNGNGKLQSELEFAVKCNTMINVDSLFDLQHIMKACRMFQKTARVLMRLHPDRQDSLKDNVNGDFEETKFGMHKKDFDEALKIAKEEPLVQLVGLHCHLEASIEDVDLFISSLEMALEWVDKIRAMGFDIQFLNVGEGLGLNYKRHLEVEDSQLKPKDFISSIADKLKAKEICLVLEPGISIIGNTGILVTKVVGVKTNENKNFIVIDGSMAEVIRPSLYGAYHHIQLIEPTQCKKEARKFDVVGPIRESTDLLAAGHHLPYPHEGCGLAIRDVGAYCSTMSSNYNMRQKPAELLVEGSRWRIIRHPETFDDLLKPYLGLPSLGVYKDYIDTTQVHLGTMHPWLTWMH